MGKLQITKPGQIAKPRGGKLGAWTSENVPTPKIIVEEPIRRRDDVSTLAFPEYGIGKTIPKEYRPQKPTSYTEDLTPKLPLSMDGFNKEFTIDTWNKMPPSDRQRYQNLAASGALAIILIEGAAENAKHLYNPVNNRFDKTIQDTETKKIQEASMGGLGVGLGLAGAFGETFSAKPNDYAPISPKDPRSQIKYDVLEIDKNQALYNPKQNASKPGRTIPTYSPISIPFSSPIQQAKVSKVTGGLSGAASLAAQLGEYVQAKDQQDKYLEYNDSLKKKYGISDAELRTIEEAYKPSLNYKDWMDGKTKKSQYGLTPEDYNRYGPLGVEDMIRAYKRGMTPEAFRKQWDDQFGASKLPNLPFGPFPQTVPGQKPFTVEDPAKPKPYESPFQPTQQDLEDIKESQKLRKQRKRQWDKDNPGANPYDNPFNDAQDLDAIPYTPDDFSKPWELPWLPYTLPDGPYGPGEPGAPGEPGKYPGIDTQWGIRWSHKGNPNQWGWLIWLQYPNLDQSVDEFHVAYQSGDFKRGYFGENLGAYEKHVIPVSAHHLLLFSEQPIAMQGQIFGVKWAGDKAYVEIQAGIGRKLLKMQFPNPASYDFTWVMYDPYGDPEPEGPPPQTDNPPQNPEREEEQVACRYASDAEKNINVSVFEPTTKQFKLKQIAVHEDMATAFQWLSGELTKIHDKIDAIDRVTQATEVKNPLKAVNFPFAEMMASTAVLFGKLPNLDYFQKYATKMAPANTLGMRMASQGAIQFAFAGHHQLAGMKMKSNVLDPKSKVFTPTTQVELAHHIFNQTTAMVGLPSNIGTMQASGKTANTSFKNNSDGIEEANAKIASIEQDVGSLLALVNAIAKNQEIQNGFLVQANADTEMLIKDAGFKYGFSIKHVPSLFQQSKPEKGFSANFLERILQATKNQRIVRKWDDKVDKSQMGHQIYRQAAISADPYKVSIPKSGAMEIPLWSNATFRESKQGKSSGSDVWAKYVKTIENPDATFQSSSLPIPSIKELVKGSFRDVPEPKDGKSLTQK